MKLNNTHFYLSHLDSSLNSEPLLSSIDRSMPPSNSVCAPLELGNLNQIHTVDQSQTRFETQDFTNPNDKLEIRVEGIPHTGAKSRVETQIRLSIQLTSKNGVKAPYWSYLRIKESMLARSKLKKSQYQKLLDGSTAAMVSDETKVLDLEARVVCESDENKNIKMCQGCVRRERKRAERKKNTRPSNYKTNLNVEDEKFEIDRQRVLIFNCESLVSFSTGEAVLPTRITCYCRHHNERVGFRIRFTARNSKGVIVATGDTPPVMITDDHKSTKQGNSSFITAYNSRKRPRNVLNEYESESDVITTPNSSRRNSFSGSDTGSDTHQALSSTSSSPVIFQHLSSVDASSRSSLNSNGTRALSPQTPGTPNLGQNMMNNNSFSNQCSAFKMPNSNGHCTTQEMISHPITLQENEFGEHEALPPTRRRRRLENAALLDTCNPSLLTMNTVQQQMDYDQVLNSPPYLPTSTLAVNSPGSLDIPNFHHSTQSLIPILNNITPSQGPTYGGIEVTIDGEGFHQGLTLMFGNRAATTVCCSSTFMVCILPPTEKNESVMVSFKDHPLFRSSKMPSVFEYYEQDTNELVDFTFQAVGLKKTIQTVNQNHHLQTVESEILQTLSGNCFNFSSLSSQTNVGGQNLLHLAAYFNLGHVVKFLAQNNPDLIHSIDRNGLTPLHFSCLRKSTQAISALLEFGAVVAQNSSIGTAMDVVANSLNPLELQDIERQVHQGTTNVLNMEEESSVTWLPNLFVYAAVQFCQQINFESIEPLFTQQQSTVMSQKNDTLFYNL